MNPGPPEKSPSNDRRNGPTHRSRRWVPLAGGLLLVSLIVAGLWPKPVPVETAVVGRGLLRATVNEEGKTRIRQRYTVAAPVAGQLRRITFKAGAEVVAGETILAVIDPVSPTLLDARSRTTAEAKRESALANLEKARTGHAYLLSELRRFVKLSAEKTISVQELESAQMKEASSAKEEAAAQGALRQAEAELSEFAATDTGTNNVCAAREIKAPSSGRVLRVFEENARVVTAGTPIMEIGDPSDLEVVVEVLSRDGAVIRPGTKVEFEQWGGSEPLLGRVRLVEPAAFTKVSALGVEEQRVNVVADLITPPEQRKTVGDNFRVDAKIIVWEANDALKVPAGALFRQGDQWATFTLVEGRARLKGVQVGRSSGTEMQVKSGLEPGETVILYPSSRVRQSQKVTPIQVGAK